ncbi:hypothetical protein ACM9NN_30455, partial [Pseudomonas paraeruginosa]
DPSTLDGDEAQRDAAFRATLARIAQRCRAFLGLPFATLDRDQLKRALERIGSRGPEEACPNNYPTSIPHCSAPRH